MNSIFNISDDDINLFITSYNKNLLNGTVEPQIPMYVELLKTIKWNQTGSKLIGIWISIFTDADAYLDK